MKRLIHIVGCRPNFIKLAPVYRAAKDKFEQIIIHTGQHYDNMMSQIFFKELELAEPNFNFNAGETIFPMWQLNDILGGFWGTLPQYDIENSIVIVYGDTNSTLAGALAAVKLGFKVAHVEAGVYAQGENNQETINRKLIDSISNWKFNPILVAQGYANFVGDVMYDQLLWGINKLSKLEKSKYESDPLGRANIEAQKKTYTLVTIHREENTTPKRFDKIERAINGLDKWVFWPRHPRTPNASPISYLQMLAHIRDAEFVITDSGGVQKEAFWFGTPCITVRKQTEWVETVQSGWNKLAEPEKIADKMNEGWKMIKPRPNPYGDGHAAERIVDILGKTK